MDKKIFVLRDAGGDIMKRWFVAYKVDGKWRKKYGNINQFLTVRERRIAAALLIEELEGKPMRPKLRIASERWLETNRARWRLKSYQ